MIRHIGLASALTVVAAGFHDTAAFAQDYIPQPPDEQAYPEPVQEPREEPLQERYVEDENGYNPLPLQVIYLPYTVGQSLAWPDADYETRAYTNLMSELEAAEQMRFSTLYSALNADYRIALLDTSEKLPVGHRGLFAVALSEGELAETAALLGFLAYISGDARELLARQAARRDQGGWQTLMQYTQSALYSEIAWSLFVAEPAGGCPNPPYPRIADYTAMPGSIIGAGDPDAVTPDAPAYEAAPAPCSQATLDFMNDWHEQVRRVLRGQNVPPGDAPWQAQLIRSGEGLALRNTPLARRWEVQHFGERLPDWENRHVCGGVYLGDRWVVTAAHCVDGKTPGEIGSQMRLRLGTVDASAGGEEYEISAAVIHADYRAREGDFRHDIALLRLAQPMQSDRVQRAIPASSPNRQNTGAGPLELTGWGLTQATTNTATMTDLQNRPQRYARILQRGDLYIRNYRTCGNTGQLRDITIWPGQLCAGSNAGTDACRGDSGGPLVRQTRAGRELIGIVSYGAGCGLNNTAKIFVDIGYYRSWIEQAIENAEIGTITRMACSVGSNTRC